jgi:hypothetical protein
VFLFVCITIGYVFKQAVKCVVPVILFVMLDGYISYNDSVAVTHFQVTFHHRFLYFFIFVTLHALQFCSQNFWKTAV